MTRLTPGARMGLFRHLWLSLTISVLSLTATMGAASESSGFEPIVHRSLTGLRAEVAVLLVQGLQGGGLQLATGAYPEHAVAAQEDGSKLRLPVRFEVAASDLVALSGDGEPLRLEFYLYAVTGDGTVAGHLARELELDAEHLTQVSFSSGVRLAGEIELPLGRYSLRFLVFDPATHRFRLELLDVSLPAEEERWLSPPRIAESCSRWLPTAVDDEPLDPSGIATRPVIRSGSRIDVAAYLMGTGPRPSLAWSPVVRLVGRKGLPEQEIPAELKRLEVKDGRVHRVTLAFDLPEVAPGAYDLSVRLTGESSSHVSASVETWVLGPASLRAGTPVAPAATVPGCGPTWGEVVAALAGGRWRLAQQELSKRNEVEVAGGGSLRRRAARGYRRALLDYVEQGSQDKAVEEMARAEFAFVAEHPSRMPALRRGELETARTIDASEGHAVLPLLVLHHEAYLEHFRRQRFALATHSRVMVMELAELLNRRSTDFADRGLVADVLTSLAEYAERQQMSILSQQLLGQALEFDADHEEARLLLAISYERIGRYLTAREELRALVTGSSQNMEARLRLAVMMERTGDFKACERTLRKLVRERPADWLLSLAYQTLARVVGRRRDFDEAVRLLEQAVDRLPDDQRLQLLLAYCLDRAGRPREAAQLVERVPVDALDAGRTHRYHYAESPAAALAPLRKRLDQAVAVRLPRLARALESTSSGRPES